MKSGTNSLLFPGQIFVSDKFWQWWWNQSIWSRSCCWSSWCVILQLELVLNRTLHLLEGLYFSVSTSLPTFSLCIIWCTSFWAPTFSLLYSCLYLYHLIGVKNLQYLDTFCCIHLYNAWTTSRFIQTSCHISPREKCSHGDFSRTGSP